MKRIQQVLAPKPLPPDPRTADRASRLAALTNAHYSTSSGGGSAVPSPHVAAAAAHPTFSAGAPSGSRRPNTAPALNGHGNGQSHKYPSAADEKRMLEAELVSEAVCASLRGTDPEAWRAQAEASWRAQAGSVGVSRVRREERLMLEAQELSAAAEEWRLRAEEAWERHLLEGDDDTMQEMKDAQRRAKKYEARMMDKLALLAVAEEDADDAPAPAVPPRPVSASAAVVLPSEDSERRRQEAALEELHKRRQAHEASAAARRAIEARRAAKAAYKSAWDTLQNNINAYAAAAPFVATNLQFAAFPWPLYSPVKDVQDITRDKVLEFVCEREPAKGGGEEQDDGARRAMVRAALKIWSPAGDRFAARVLRHVEPASRDAVLEGHALVVRILNGELARLG